MLNHTPVTATGITVTVQVAVKLPSAVVTVIVAVPTDTAVTFPCASTVAIAGLLLDHVTFWLVALAGAMVAIRVSLSPMGNVVDVLFSVTPVTDCVTVTVAVAIRAPSSVVTVMVAVPGAAAVTRPLASTVATDVLSLRHVTFWLVALAGAMMATKVSVAPTLSVAVVLFSVTPVTRCSTVIVLVAECPPSAVVTVIVAVPGAMAVTNPLAFTVATAELLLDHVTFLLVASAGTTVAVSVVVEPTLSVAAGVTVTPVGGITCSLTVTVAVALCPPSSVVTVILAVPGAMALTNPLALTVAIAELLLAHVTFRLVALAGNTLAVSVSVPPTVSERAVALNVTPVAETEMVTLLVAL